MEFSALGWALMSAGLFLLGSGIDRSILYLLANPFFCMGVLFFLLKRDRLAVLFAMLGCLIAFAPGLEYLANGAEFRVEPAIALGFGIERRTELRIGYFIWVITHVLLCCTTIFSLGLSRFGSKAAIQ
ncbi:MAG: hypothetical protein EXR98_17395 [Gemmataceae bacterium]|nr:hypothetical protein [Gemmataceae bacterium]